MFLSCLWWGNGGRRSGFPTVISTHFRFRIFPRDEHCTEKATDFVDFSGAKLVAAYVKSFKELGRRHLPNANLHRQCMNKSRGRLTIARHPAL